MKTAFVFPGQGSQKVGMLQDLYNAYPIVKQRFEEADEALGYSISKLCFEGPDTELVKTANTQPAILTASVACYEVLKEQGFTPDIVGGHSLGEYSALVAAGVLDFKDAVYVVHKRGEYMQEAVPLGKGAMAAILALPREQVVEICQQVNDTVGSVQAVNFNCPGQIVIAGETAAVETAAEKMKEAGAKRAVMLPVSAPFHSRLMEPAALRLKEELDKIEHIISNELTAYSKVNVARLHNLVEQALDEVNEAVAKSYRDYRNYKNEFVYNVIEDMEMQVARTLTEEDKSNSNSNSKYISTKRTSIAQTFAKEMYQKMHLSLSELQAIKTGFIYIHDLCDMLLPQFNCCLFDVGALLKGGFTLEGVKYREPRNILTAIGQLGDATMIETAQHFG